MAKNNSSVYLNRLRFKKEFLNKYSSKYLLNTRLVVLILLGIIPMGIFSFINLPRRLNPEVEIPIVTIATLLPGASADEVEQLITIPTEEAVSNIENVDTHQSISQDNVSIVTVEFISTVTPDKAKTNVQAAVDSISELPDSASVPNVTSLDFENIPVLTFSIYSGVDNYSSLNSFSEILKDKLESNPNVREVVISGNEKKEIQILSNPEYSYLNNINPLTLSRSITSSLVSYPAGNLKADQILISASVKKTILSVEDLRNISVDTGQNIVKLGDVTEISIKAPPNQLESFVANSTTTPKKAITLEVYKNTASTIETTANQAQTIIDEYFNQSSDDFKYLTTLSTANEIDKQFSDLNQSFMLTLLLVFLTLFIFLGIRQSTIVAASIPIIILISFTSMNLLGLTLNFLSVFSILLALGLLVDDAIVIVSAMTTYFRTKKFSSTETGILVWRDFIVPIWSTTITTIWAFIPLLLSTGIIGEFIKTIPLVVTATLLASTSVAVLITLPTTMIVFDLNIPERVTMFMKIVLFIFLISIFFILVPKNPAGIFILGFILYILFLLVTYDIRRQLFQSFFQKLKAIKISKSLKKYIRSITNKGVIDPTKFTQKYFLVIKNTLENPKAKKRVVIFTVIFAIFSYSLVPLGVVRNEFFPKIDSEVLSIQIELPAGSTRELTKKETLKILKEVRHLPEVDFAVADIGRAVDSFGFAGQSSTNISRITLRLKEQQNSKNSIQIAENLRNNFAQHTKSNISVIEQSAGPPVGADVQIKFLGDDLGVLDSLADQTVIYLSSQLDLTNVDKSIKPSTSNYSFYPKQLENTEKGLTNDILGLNLRSYLSGFPIAETTINEETYEIVYRLFEDTPAPSDINRLKFISEYGEIPFSDLVETKLEPSPSRITRENGKRTISVIATVKPGYSVSLANQNVEKYISNDVEIPDSYSWQLGGVEEENQRSVTSILQAMILSAILILGTMVLQLGSFRKSIIVFLVIPLAISGVFVSFAITGTPLSFPALIGVLALFGIVVNNSIVVVEKINQNLKAGIKYTEAIADAAASRVEPIMFSSLTTIIGLIPITITDPLWRGLGGAIISGLTVSGLIMLFFIPVVFHSWFSND